jgi:hypothetical protein
MKSATKKILYNCKLPSNKNLIDPNDSNLILNRPESTDSEFIKPQELKPSENNYVISDRILNESTPKAPNMIPPMVKIDPLPNPFLNREQPNPSEDLITDSNPLSPFEIPIKKKDPKKLEQPSNIPLPVFNFFNPPPPPPPAFNSLPQFINPHSKLSNTPMPGLPPMPCYVSPPIFANSPPNLPPIIPSPNYPSQITSNIFEICFEELKTPQTISTGDGTQCKACKAFFSVYSKLTPNWVCEYCGTENIIKLDSEEIPQKNKIVYVLETITQAAGRNNKKNNEKTVIFCIDVSGSMCVTVPVQGRFKFKTSRLEELKREMFGIVGPEWMDIEHSNVTYVSRLECVQAAIETQLNNLYATSPATKVGVVTFNDEVTILGDGTDSEVVSGDKLNSFEQLDSCVQNKFTKFLSSSILNSKETLCKRLFSLKELGSTALGPGLFISVSLAAQAGSGSKVIVCTDGVANKGLGNLEEDEKTDCYDIISQIAQEKGIEISVISISDEDCRLDLLTPIVEKTGGDLCKINPQNLDKDFANILSNEVYATNAIVTVILPNHLAFINQDPNSLKSPRILEKNIGNINNETMFTFEFEVCDNSIDKVPLQICIQYKDINGNKFVFVHTEIFDVSDEYLEVIKDADFSIIAKNAQIQSGNLIRQGQLTEASHNLDRWAYAMKFNCTSEEQVNSLGFMISNTSSVQQKISENLYPQGLNTGTFIGSLNSPNVPMPFIPPPPLRNLPKPRPDYSLTNSEFSFGPPPNIPLNSGTNESKNFFNCPPPLPSPIPPNLSHPDPSFSFRPSLPCPQNLNHNYSPMSSLPNLNPLPPPPPPRSSYFPSAPARAFNRVSDDLLSEALRITKEKK